MKKRRFKKYISSILALTFIISTLPISPFSAMNIYGSEGVGFDLDISLSDAIMEGRKNINLDWEPIVFENEEEKTRYLVARKNLDSGEWELRGNYNKDVIRVLNIYPDNAGSSGLKNWMDNIEKITTDITVSIDVTPLRIYDFNNSPQTYLYKNESGEYNYDVVVFGFWDGNNSKDLNANSVPVIQEFIDNDGGVVFGHDTLAVKGLSSNANFSQIIQANLSLEATPKNTGNRIVSDEIKVVKQSSATTYPFDINNEVLTIPFSRTVAQIPTNPNSVLLAFEKNVYKEDGSGPYFNQSLMPIWTPPPSADDVFLTASDGKTYDTNAYLIKEGNVAYIQTGHSSGTSNTAEQKVLANLIYSLSYFYFDEHGIDQALDATSPKKPEYTVIGDKIILTSEDLGNKYTYRVLAAPIGYSFRENSKEIITRLDDFNIDSYGDSVKFSEPVTIDVVGGIKNYYYDINNNPTYLSSKYKVLNTDEFTIPTVTEGLTKDTYVHFASVDMANNKSKILSLKLWDLLKDEDIKVLYEDRDGNQKAPPIIESAKIGTRYNCNIVDIEGYRYSNNANSIIVSADPAKNEVTLIYDKVIYKQFYKVEHNGTIEIMQGDHSEPNIENGILDYDVENLEQFDFLGYYTVGSKEILADNKFAVSGKTAQIMFDNTEPIYFHYERKSTDVTYKATRSDTKAVLSSYTKDGKVGLSATFTQEEILSEIISNIDDIEYYSNVERLFHIDNLYVPNLAVDSSENVKTVELIPKKVKIIYSGYDYDLNEKEHLKTVEIPYGNSKTMYTPIENFDGWTYSASSYDVIDFSKDNLVVYVNYYRGTPPITKYGYSVNYINAIDNKPLITSGSAINLSMTTPPTIEIKNFENVGNIAGTSRLVDFEVSHIVVTYPDKSSTTILPTESIQDVMPIKNDEGNLLYGFYEVSVYYLPYTKVVCNETIKTNSGDINNTIIFDALYNNKREYYSSPEDLNHYNVLSVSVDGKSIPVDDFDFSMLVDAYEKTIDIIYAPKTYDLTINVISGGNKKQYIKYEDVFIRDSKTIKPPIYEGYEFDFMELSSSIENDCLVDNVFLPKTEGDYVINLYYKQNSIVDVIYTDLDGGEISPNQTHYGYVDEKLTIDTPNEIKDNYKLEYIYLDGSKIDVKNISATFIPKKANHNIKLVYKQTNVSNLTILVNEGGGVTGTGTYVHGDTVNISAVPLSGFKFDYWEDSEYITDKYNPNISIIMPKSDVTLKAIFKKEIIEEDDDDDNDNGNDTSSGNNSTTDKIDNNIDVLKPTTTIEMPTLPDNITPEQTLEIDKLYKLAKESEKEITRKYMKYVDGYPDGTVGPDLPTKRSEIAQIIFNLYATEDDYDVSVLNYSDISEDIWYANALAYTSLNNIISGYPDGTYRPDNSITKAELATIILRVIGEDVPTYETPFLDIEDSWAKDDIKKLYGLGIIKGDGTGYFKPQANATRAELVTLINRIINRPMKYNDNFIIPDLDKNHWAYEQVMSATQENLSLMYEELTKVQQNLDDEINKIIN